MRCHQRNGLATGGRVPASVELTSERGSNYALKTQVVEDEFDAQLRFAIIVEAFAIRI